VKVTAIHIAPGTRLPTRAVDSVVGGDIPATITSTVITTL